MTKVQTDSGHSGFVRKRKLNPPRLYALTVIAGALLTLLWQANIFPIWGQLVFGPIFLAGGGCLHIWAFREFERAGTTVEGYKPASTLVTTGPYKYTRNPLYVSMSLMVLGTGLLFDSLWMIILLVPLNIYIHFSFINREENYLREKFGDDYDAYFLSVRRWI